MEVPVVIKFWCGHVAVGAVYNTVLGKNIAKEMGHCSSMLMIFNATENSTILILITC